MGPHVVVLVVWWKTEKKRERERGVVHGTPKRYLLLSRKNNTFSKYNTFFKKKNFLFAKTMFLLKKVFIK